MSRIFIRNTKPVPEGAETLLRTTKRLNETARDVGVGADGLTTSQTELQRSIHAVNDQIERNATELGLGSEIQMRQLVQDIFKGQAVSHQKHAVDMLVACVARLNNHKVDDEFKKSPSSAIRVNKNDVLFNDEAHKKRFFELMSSLGFKYDENQKTFPVTDQNVNVLYDLLDQDKLVAMMEKLEKKQHELAKKDGFCDPKPLENLETSMQVVKNAAAATAKDIANSFAI